jgi:hypothetical protein
MLTEPMPPAMELLATTETTATWSPGRVIGAVAAAAAVVAVIVGASLLGQSIGIGGPPTGGEPSASLTSIGSVPEDMAGWADAADESILDHIDRHSEPSLTLARLERCGATGIAFYADPRSPTDHPLVVGFGNYRQEPYEAGFGGAATSVDDSEAAYGRSQLDSCEVVFDTILTAEVALAAYLEGAGTEVTDVRVLATKQVSDDIALAFVTEVRTSDGGAHQQIVVLRRDQNGWTVTGSQGGEYPTAGAAVGVTALGTAKGMPDDRRAAVGVTTDEVTAVELEFDGFVHRYPVADGAFVIQIPPTTGFAVPYRLLDAAGAVVASGTSNP